MKSSIFNVFAVIVVSILCNALPARGNDSDQKPVYSVTDLKVEKGPKGKDCVINIPFDDNQDQVSVKMSDGKHKIIHVKLNMTEYKGTLVNQKTLKTKTMQRTIICYELESKDKDVPYSWCMWANGIYGRFKSFITSDGETYLTWISFNTLRFTNISNPMNQAEKMKKLDDYANRAKQDCQYIQYINVYDVVGEKQGDSHFINKDTSALYYSIYVDSFEKDQKGGYKIQLHGADPSKIYTIVTDNKSEYGWRLEE